MTRKVIFFLGNCFSQNDYKRFGFKIFKERGYKVEGWDFTPWLNYNYYNKYKNYKLNTYKNYKTLKNSTEIYKAISRLSSSDIIIDLFLITKNKKIFYNLKKKNIMIGTLTLGNMPNIKNFSFFRKFLIKISLILNNPYKKIYNLSKKIFSLFINFFKQNNIIPCIDFIIVGGKNWKDSINYRFSNKISIIKAHSFDYDRYLERKSKNNIYKYSVFLDEDMPFHSDYEYLGIKPYCNADIYYREINNFFSDYEKKTGLKVIIAACPRTDYKKRNNPYNNRKIISNSAASLVKNAKHVFIHMSTSVNFAILFKKPVIIINSNNYDKLIAQASINNLCKEISAKKINISKTLPDSYDNLKINKKKYEFFKERYIKEKNTPEKFIWDIFCNYLDKLNKSNIKKYV